MSRRTLALTDAVYDYCLKLGVREHPVLTELRDITASMPGAKMQIGADQGQLMWLLTKLMNSKRTLDIGCFTGYSALCVALALPSDGQVHTFDVDPNATNVAKNYWQKAGMDDKIQLHLGPAVDHLQGLLNEGLAGQFDFAFIDADKLNYTNYYELALKLLRVGGLIAIDNCLWNGAVADPSDQDPQTVAIRELNAFVNQDQRVEICLLTTGDGLFLARKCD